MRCIVLCLLASLAFLSDPASAGNYPERAGRVWYTSSCCYLKIVRDGATVRYVRVKRSYRTTQVCYDWRYRAYYPWPYYGPPHSTYYPYRSGVSSRYANYLPPPDCRLVRLTDGAGGWIWARRAGCL